MTKKRDKDVGGPSPAAPPDALEWREGTYVLVRLPTTEYRDKVSALAEARRRFPGGVIGQSQVVRGKWIIRVKPEKGTKTDA